MGNLLYQNAGGKVWTRTYDGDNKGVYYGNCINAYDGSITNLPVTESHYVAPAFLLNLEDVLIARDASSATENTPLSFMNVVSDDIDLKFLINAGTNKSNFDVPSINGKVLSNVVAGATYSFDYSGASIKSLNDGTNYVSAIIYDKDGKIEYYGNLNEITSKSGTSEITIPSDIAKGTHTLALFEEEKCDEHKTDYASQLIYANFTIE